VAAPVVREALKLGVYVKSHPRGAELGAPLLELHVTAQGGSCEEAREKVERAVRFLAEELGRLGARVERVAP